MTAQISDIVRYNNMDFSLVGINGEGLFEPAAYGMNPTSWCTACWRGFLTTYEVKDKKLLLNELQVCLTAPSMGGRRKVDKIPAPLITNINATDISKAGNSFFEYKYENMCLPISYSGGLLIASGFIEELYVHMGFHPAWKYREVHELIFENGLLIKEYDVSEKMKEFRDDMKGVKLRPDLTSSDDDLIKWIERCFSRKYRM